MTSRLIAADEGTKESKWADIDDDEDDWAPEPVQWLDGTKSTVNSVDQRPPQIPVIQDVPVIIPSEPLIPPTILQPSSKVTAKTILKPGSVTLGQGKGSGSLVLKSSMDKSNTPKATAVAATPAKSPWAPLPPVDKVSPVPFVHPIQPPVQNFPREPAPHESLPLVSPKEIAADDFNRGWDGELPRHKTLFNSQSGLMESVNENNKRGQPRGESGHRQPAVLQRSYNQGEPAGPSAAFQTRNAGMDTWQPRHRTGSVGSAGRRMSIGRLKDAPYGGYDGTSLLPGQEAGQVQQGPPQQKPWARNSPNAQPVQPVGSEEVDDAVSSLVAVPPTPSTLAEDPVVVQQRLMREKIERARQQKQKQLEEERREEEARKERLRLKMAALAGPTPSPTIDHKELKLSSQDASPQTMKVAQLASPPKPPVPTTEGEVAQYGMMKVHQPHPVKRPHASEAGLMHQPGPDGKKTTLGAESSPQRFPPGSRHANANTDARRQGPVDGSTPEAGWRPGALPEKMTGWGSSTISNLWAPPLQSSKDRALGNGTFDSSGFVRIPSQGVQGRSKPGAPSANAPRPIAPPHNQTGAPAHAPEAGHSFPPRNNNAPYPIPPSHPDQNFIDNHQEPLLTQEPPPPELQSTMASAVQPQMPPHYQQPTKRFSHADWAALPDKLAMKDQAQKTTYMQKYREAQNGLPKRPNPVILEETFHRTSVGPLGSQPTILSVEKRVHGPGYTQDENIMPNGVGHAAPHRHHQYPQPPFVGTRPSPIGDAANMNGEKSSSAPTAGPTTSQTGNAAVLRASRFFPRIMHEDSDNSDSPPPPELSSLDVGITMLSPVVHLPKIAVVKLPPSSTSPELSHANLASTPPASRHSNASAAPPADWQRRIDNLLRSGAGRSPHEHQGFILAPKPIVDAASAAPIDMANSQFGATVSLPAAGKDDADRRAFFKNDKSSSVQSRQLDEDLFPQPEFGSTPTIEIPKFKYPHLEQLDPARSNPDQNPAPFIQQEHYLSLSKANFDASDMLEGPRGGYWSITVRPVPGSSLKAVALPMHSRSNSRVHGSSHRGSRRATPHGSSSTRGVRKGSGQYTPRDGQSQDVRNITSHRGSNRGPRGNSHFGRRNITAPAVSATQ